MKKFLFLFLLGFTTSHLVAQQFKHHDFIGAGHDNGITVKTSSANNTAKGEKTVDGFAIQNDQQLKDASRFLAQATFGADMATIEMTAAMGYEAWLEEQFGLPQTSVLAEMYQQTTAYNGAESVVAEGIYKPWFESAWMSNNLTAPDLLRQRMNFILSEIFVINNNSDFFEDVAQIGGRYYDNLGENAFKNYRSLINEVTLSPAMGLFLSHYNNPKADPEKNIHPDENYAREIMQLFSIGLWELNQNGRRKYDANNQFIPTYNNADIKEFAQVFTGLGDGTPTGVFGNFDEEEEEEEGNLLTTVTTPMKMYDNYHDTSEKHLLNGLVLPSGQTGVQDLNQTLDHLSSHPNTAPFITKSLIKFLTTSNPSSAYVERVAGVFNPFETDNFQKVIKAILLDPEARTCQPTENYTFGKLREPLVRYMNFLKAFPTQGNQNGDYIFQFGDVNANIGQAPLSAPSVFNFFLPEYAPPGDITQQYKVAPEFQILNSTNSIGIINELNNQAVKRLILNNGYEEEGSEEEEEVDEEDEEEEEADPEAEENNEGEDEESEEEGGDVDPFENQNYLIDFGIEEAIANNASQLVNHLDILLANGLLSGETKGIIKQAIEQLDSPADRVKMATYLILISPDYAILK